MASKSVDAVTLGLQAGTTRTVYATWNKTSYKKQDGYEVVWQYGTGQGVWFDGSSSTVSGTNDTYTAPSNAIKVKCKVKPHPGSDAKWEGKFVSAVFSEFPVEMETVDDDGGHIIIPDEGGDDSGGGGGGDDSGGGGGGDDSGGGGGGDDSGGGTTPAAPSNISVTISGTTVTATVTNYRDDRSNGILRIEIVEDDARVVHEGDVVNEYGVASLVWNPTTLGGKRYKARAMAYGKEEGVVSNWSAYCTNVELLTPAAPSNISITISGTTVTATVTNYQDDHSNDVLRIQIVEDDVRVVHEGDVKNVYGVASLVWNGATLGGKRYKARAMAYGLDVLSSKYGDYYGKTIFPGVDGGNAGGKDGIVSKWSAYCENKYTTPGKTLNLTLSAISSDSVNARWGATIGAGTYTIQFTATVVDGKPVFDTASSDVQEASGITSTYYPTSSLTLGKKWYFRVKAVNEAGEGEWSDIASIVLGTTPDIPTIWSYITVGKVGTPIVLNWVHSSQDESAQSGARIGIKVNDGAETVIELTTQTTYTYQTASLGDGYRIKWRVSTRGIQGIAKEWSDYSEYREIVVYTPPAVAFTVGVPDGVEYYPVVGSFPFAIEGYSSPSTQSAVSFHISIKAKDQYDIAQDDGIEVHVTAGQEIYQKYIPTVSNIFRLELNPGDIFLNEGTDYDVTVTVATNVGLSASTTRQFTAKWEKEYNYDPDAEVTVDRRLLIAYIRPFCMDKWGFEIRKGFRLAIYRIDHDGNLTQIATDIDPKENVTITDLHPSLDYARYRIVATSILTGVVFYSDLEGIPVHARTAVIQWEGEARAVYIDTDDVDYVINDWCGTILRLPYNLDVADDISQDVSLVSYIGRSYPVSYYGTQKGATSRWSAEIPKTDVESIAKVRALAIYPGDVYIREPAGSGYWANVKVSYDISYSNPVVPVTFTITRVEGGA